MKRGFSGHHDRRSIGGGLDQTLTSFGYTSLSGKQYDCPLGSITDGASTMFFWGHINLFPTPAQNNRAPTLHDLHYRTGWVWRGKETVRRITRKEADQVFKEGLEMENLYFVAWYGYLGLRLFGWLAWWKYRREESNENDLTKPTPPAS